MIIRKYLYKINVFKISFIFIAILISFSSYSVGNGITTTSQEITVSINPKEDKTNQASINNNTIIKHDIDLDSQKSILKVMHTSEIDVDEEIVTLLSRFKNKPDSLDLINELSAKEDRLLQYAKQQIDNNISWSNLVVTIEAMSLINSANTQLFFNLLENKYISNIDLNNYILHYLREMPQSDDIDSYLNLLLQKNPKDFMLVRNILLSMAIYKAPDIARWAAYYRSPGIDAEVRFLGLYLASTLGKDETLQRWILEILFDENKPPTYQHYYLLVALSRQMSDEHFYDFLSRSYIAEKVIVSVKLERQFYQGDTELRLQLASKLIKSSYAEQRNAAISFLLKEQGFEKTWQQLNQQQRLSAIRLSYKLGIPLVSESNDEPIKDNYFWYVLILSIIGLLVFIGYKRES